MNILNQEELIELIVSNTDTVGLLITIEDQEEEVIYGEIPERYGQFQLEKYSEGVYAYKGYV